MKCKFCPHTEEEHEKLHHPFTPEDSEGGSLAFLDPKKHKKADKGGATAQVSVKQMTGGDPVLRLALINKGILTLADIIAAERQIDDASSSGRPAVAQAPAPGHPEDRPPHA